MESVNHTIHKLRNLPITQFIDSRICQPINWGICQSIHWEFISHRLQNLAITQSIDWYKHVTHPHILISTVIYCYLFCQSVDYGICNEKICQLMNISICRLKNLSITSVDCVIDTFNKAQIDRLDRFLNLQIVWLTLTDSTICGDEIGATLPTYSGQLVTISGSFWSFATFSALLKYVALPWLWNIIVLPLIHYIIIRYTLQCISLFSSYISAYFHIFCTIAIAQYPFILDHTIHILITHHLALSADFNLSDYRR